MRKIYNNDFYSKYVLFTNYLLERLSKESHNTRCRKQAGEEGNLPRMLLQGSHVGYRGVSGE